MEVKGLKLSSSFYFADYNHFSQDLRNKSLPESKIIWRLYPLALNVQCKTVQFCETGKIVSKFIFIYYLPFLGKKLVLFDILVE